MDVWELDHKESWTPKNWCFWTVVLEKTLESPVDRKEIQPVHPKGDQSWIFIGRTDAEAESPKLWLPDVKNWLIWKDPDAGKDWRQEEKGTTEDELVGWPHWLDGHDEFAQALGVGDEQGSLACSSLWIHKESDTLSSWTDLPVAIALWVRVCTSDILCTSPECFTVYSSSIHHKMNSSPFPTKLLHDYHCLRHISIGPGI